MKQCNIKHRNERSKANCYICSAKNRKIEKSAKDYAKKLKIERTDALNRFKKNIKKDGLTAETLNDILKHGGLTRTETSPRIYYYSGYDHNHISYNDLIQDFTDSKNIDPEDFQGKILAISKEIGEIRGEEIDYDYDGSSPSFVFSIKDPVTNYRKYYRKLGQNSSYQRIWDEDKIRQGITANIYCNFVGNNENFSLTEVKPKTNKRVIYETTYE